MLCILTSPSLKMVVQTYDALMASARARAILKASSPCLLGAKGLRRSLSSSLRHFPYPSSKRYRRSLDMNDDVLKLQVNRDRLMADIHHTCQMGKGERWGE